MSSEYFFNKLRYLCFFHSHRIPGMEGQRDYHFLFNSLSSLVTLIGKDQEKAAKFVHRLSDVYRYVLDQTENELVPVSEELKFPEDYVFLQRSRISGNGWTYKIFEIHFLYLQFKNP